MDIERDLAVFINCPYDNEYRDIFEALIFAVIVCGFIPTSAKTPIEGGLSRIDRIFKCLDHSGFSFHDLSRCKGEGDDNLARFNMPLELGIAMGQKIYAENNDKPGHDWCLLVRKDSNYKRVVSDLAGYDPREYEGEISGAIQAVMVWLSVQQNARPDMPPPRLVMDVMDDYLKMVEGLRDDWLGDEIPWHMFLKAAGDFAVKSELL